MLKVYNTTIQQCYQTCRPKSNNYTSGKEVVDIAQTPRERTTVTIIISIIIIIIRTM